MPITYERVRELFDYREDGKLIWRISRGRVKAGSTAGTICKTLGYCLVRIDGVLYRAHRIIWLWHYGYFPEGDLDHRNRIKSDNWIENLREASDQCNSRNTGNPKHNTSGVKGVRTCERWGDIWQSYIHVSSKRYHLGNFADFDEAVLHRLAAEQCLDWSGCYSSSPAYLYAVNNNLIKPNRKKVIK